MVWVDELRKQSCEENNGFWVCRRGEETLTPKDFQRCGRSRASRRFGMARMSPHTKTHPDQISYACPFYDRQSVLRCHQNCRQSQTSGKHLKRVRSQVASGSCERWPKPMCHAVGQHQKMAGTRCDHKGQYRRQIGQPDFKAHGRVPSSAKAASGVDSSLMDSSTAINTTAPPMNVAMLGISAKMKNASIGASGVSSALNRAV